MVNESPTCWKLSSLFIISKINEPEFGDHVPPSITENFLDSSL